MSGQGASVAADAGPPDVVETFTYPGADQIFSRTGVRLISGDGHLLLADCGTKDVIIVMSRKLPDTCFRVLGSGGWLTLQVPYVYGIFGNSDAVTATVATATGETEVSVPAGLFAAVGESAGAPSDTMLVKLVATS